MTCACGSYNLGGSTTERQQGKPEAYHPHPLETYTPHRATESPRSLDIGPLPGAARATGSPRPLGVGPLPSADRPPW